MQKRPLYQGFFGAVFGVASVIGPLIGGAFTTNITWRWCFYINLPLGGAVLVYVFFVLHIPSRPTADTLKHKVQQLNVEGMLALLPGVICLCLTLQWGGFTYSVSFEYGAPLIVLFVSAHTTRLTVSSGATGELFRYLCSLSYF